MTEAQRQMVEEIHGYLYGDYGDPEIDDSWGELLESYKRELAERLLSLLKEQEAELATAQERIKALEEKYRHTHLGPDRICAKCGFDLSDDLHERIKKEAEE